MAERKLYRPLFCPICGAKVTVEVKNNGQFPEIDRIPDHNSANGMNVCSGVVVTVTLDFDKCSECGCQIAKHASGKCMKCYGKKKTATGHVQSAQP